MFVTSPVERVRGTPSCASVGDELRRFAELIWFHGRAQRTARSGRPPCQNGFLQSGFGAAESYSQQSVPCILLPIEVGAQRLIFSDGAGRRVRSIAWPHDRATPGCCDRKDAFRPSATSCWRQRKAVLLRQRQAGTAHNVCRYSYLTLGTLRRHMDASAILRRPR